jgi:hypothetical protein
MGKDSKNMIVNFLDSHYLRVTRKSQEIWIIVMFIIYDQKKSMFHKKFVGIWMIVSVPNHTHTCM